MDRGIPPPTPPLHALVESWLDSMVARNASPLTLKGYRRDMQLLAIFSMAKLDTNDPRALTLQDLEAYFSELTARGLAPQTRVRKLTSLCSCFRWLHASGHVQSNPAALLPRPRLPQRLPKYLTVDEVRRLLAAPNGTGRVDIRTRAILQVLYSSGMRLCEISTCKVAAVDLELGYIRIMGKGSKERLAQLHPTARPAVREWLTLRRDWFAHQTTVHPRIWANRDQGWLFVNFRDGGRLKGDTIWRLVLDAGERAGFTQPIHPHLLRHSLATHMMQRGVDIRLVKELLGHASISSTMVYTHVAPKQMTDAYLAAYPLD